MFTMLNSLGHFERCCVARRMMAELIDDRLEGAEAVAAFKRLEHEARVDWFELRWLLLPPSKRIH